MHCHRSTVLKQLACMPPYGMQPPYNAAAPNQPVLVTHKLQYQLEIKNGTIIRLIDLAQSCCCKQ